MQKTFEEYLNDPGIKNEPMGLRITHAMRFKVQDETKGMTPAERTAYYNDIGSEKVAATGLATQRRLTPLQCIMLTA